MRISSRILVCALLVIVAGADATIGSYTAVAPSSANPAEGSWLDVIVDADDDVGGHLSMARHHDTGQLYVSYYDATSQDLKAAWQVGSAGDGNCGPSDTWRCETVDSDGDVGLYSAIAVDPLSGNPRIAYYDVTHRALKYAAHLCDPDCQWGLETVEVGNLNPLIFSGLYPSLKVGSDGVPRIAYHRSSFQYGALKYATHVGSGGNCGGEVWQCDVIDDENVTGLYPSLDLTSVTTPLDVPYIAYYEKTKGDLRYAWYLGNGTGDCGPNNDWNCRTIDQGTFAAETGLYPVLRLNTSTEDNPGIVYYDATYDKINYAYPKTGGLCGGVTGSWQCDVINDNPINSDREWIALDLTADSVHDPFILYGCPDCYGSALAYARYLGAFGDCGPTVTLPLIGATRTWECGVLIGDSITAHDFSQAGKVSLNAGDLLSVAYYDATTGDLRFSQQQALIFLPLVIKA